MLHTTHSQSTVDSVKNYALQQWAGLKRDGCLSTDDRHCTRQASRSLLSIKKQAPTRLYILVTFQAVWNACGCARLGQCLAQHKADIVKCTTQPTGRVLMTQCSLQSNDVPRYLLLFYARSYCRCTTPRVACTRDWNAKHAMLIP